MTAEDVAQDVFLRAYKSLPDFAVKSKIIAGIKLQRAWILEQKKSVQGKKRKRE
ncbi:hypothetical protein P4V75_08705 [Brevibacillus reuszeri]|nr:hypothetical protein [Brevibacillus reuszeri]MED1856892.1 hypothetical protein [Brevibacillus reuszeri]